MIQIQSIIIRRVLMELLSPFKSATSTMTHKECLILEVRDQSGLIVFSECVALQTPNYLPDTIDTSLIVLRKYIIPLIINQRFDSPQDMYQFIKSNIRGHHMAIAALDMAAWAIYSEKKGVSLSQAIGGTKNSVESGIAFGIMASAQELIKEIELELPNRFHKYKCKISPGKDIAYLQLIRDVLGMDIPLMVDANSSYTLSDIDLLKTFDEFNLMMIEQPFAWDDIWQHQQLQSIISTPVCLDESILTSDHARMAIELGCAGIINIKPGRVGGFTEAIKIHDLCKQNQVPVWCGGMLETGIGRAYNIALASMPNFSIPGDISPSQRYWKQDIVEPQWNLNPDGMISVPLDKVGIGVTVNRTFLDSVTIEEERFG